MSADSGGPGEVDLPTTTRAALDALEGGEPVVAVLLLEGPAAGRRMLVWEATARGSLGSPMLDSRATELARETLAARSAASTRQVEVEGRRWALYVEVFQPPPELIIVGAGHIARPLCRIGGMLGFDVVVLDDRPEFATRERFPEARRVIRADFTDPLRGLPPRRSSHYVLVTRGHKFDFDVLRQLLREPVRPAYIGMVGSRRRVRAALSELAREGIDLERLEAVHAPIGLDIGAETPDEIAVAIAAEVIRLHRGGSGAPLRDRERIVERWLRRARPDPGSQ